MTIKEKAHELLAKIAGKNIKGRRYDEAGRYYPDPTPIAPPIGYVKSPTISEQIRSMIRSEHLKQAAEASGMDTFEEADDFDVGDDYDPRSPWEEQFDGEFSVPLNQEAVPRDPDDRNPPTPPAASAHAGDAPVGGFPPANAPVAPGATPAPPAAAPAPAKG